MNPRRVAVVTTTRADLWPLSSVIDCLGADARVDLRVIASGTHLDARYGRTLDEIPVAADRIVTVPVGLTGDGPADLAAALGATAAGVGAALAAVEPEVVVMLGDRAELLGAAGAALLANVPIVHLHGGERTLGAIDDAVRDALTRLATLHCCAAEEHAERLVREGVDRGRVFVTGAPGLDRLVAAAATASAEELAREVGVHLERPFALLTYHPPTRNPERLEPELDAILDATNLCGTVVATYPGADAGAERIMTRLRTWAESRPNAVLVKSLGAYYPAALANADVVLGNSSSGLIEAPTFGTPVVNVGDRQLGRTRAACVIDAAGTRGDVRAAVARALEPDFRAVVAELPNPYGDGKAAPRITELVATYDFAQQHVVIP